MMRTRIIAVACTTIMTIGATGGTALAHFCVNASKPAGAGTKVVVGEDDEGNETVNFTSPSYLNQMERAGKSIEELRGGFIGFDADGDGLSDADTYNHPKGVVPAALNGQGQECKGMTNFAEAAGCTFRQK